MNDSKIYGDQAVASTIVSSTPADAHSRPAIAIVLKGYPRLSETFIAQELKALESKGFNLVIFSLRHPTDHTIHPIHREIHAPVVYLPEYLHQEIPRVMASVWHGLRHLRFGSATWIWLKDLLRDPSLNRIRRFGQALVLAREFPASTTRIYAHFMHTPGSVARYGATLLELPWSFSAHAKDIWTIGEWEKRRKLGDCCFAVSCTQANVEHLRRYAPDRNRVQRVYHGLDFERFPDPGEKSLAGDGSKNHCVRLLSVGRAVPKKGYPVLLDALASLPVDLHWNLVHIGGGTEIKALKQRAIELGLEARITWLGAQPQERVLDACRTADLFVLASTINDDGDRDGLPNVLMEAQSQRLCCLATRVSGIPELITDKNNGFLVEADDVTGLCRCLEKLIRRPELRLKAANQAIERLHREFSQDREISTLTTLLENM